MAKKQTAVRRRCGPKQPDNPDIAFIKRSSALGGYVCAGVAEASKDPRANSLWYNVAESVEVFLSQSYVDKHYVLRSSLGKQEFKNGSKPMEQPSDGAESESE